MATKQLSGFAAKSKTQQAMKRNLLRLTLPGGDSRPFYDITPRHSIHANDAISTWVGNGVVETVAGRHNLTEYRVTAAGFDADARREAIIAYLTGEIEAAAEAAAVHAQAMSRMATVGAEFLAAMAPLDPEASPGVVRTALTDHHQAFTDVQASSWTMVEGMRDLMMHRSAITSELARVAAQGEDAPALYAAAQARAQGAPATLVAAMDDGDPLGGDA